MDITVKELSERMTSGETAFLLLDVRETHEWETGRLDGAQHIPLRQVPARLGELPREREIIVYCRMGGRSANAQQLLRANGFENVRNLIGGITAWKREIDQSVNVV